MNWNWVKWMLLVSPSKGRPLHKTPVTKSAPRNQAGNITVKMVVLGHLTWFSVKMAVRSPDLSQNGDSHMLYGEAMFFERGSFKHNNMRDLET